MLSSQTLVASIEYNLGSQRITGKSTCRHLFCYGQLSTMATPLLTRKAVQFFYSLTRSSKITRTVHHHAFAQLSV